MAWPDLRARACAWMLAAALAPPALARGQAAEASAELTRALAAHPYFARVEFERVESDPRFVFLFQQVKGAKPDRVPAYVELMAPALAPTLALFEDWIAKPVGLVLRPGHARFLVVVLASPGDLSNYKRVTGAREHLAVEAYFDDALDAVVVYEDAFQPERPWAQRARAARHALVHACQRAWAPAGKEARLETWLFEGMADALAHPSGGSSDCHPEGLFLRQFVFAAGDARARFGHLRTVEELLAVQEPARLEAFFHQHAPQGFTLGASDWSAFQRYAALFFTYLWSGDDARHRPALAAFVGDALAGADTPARFQERFAATPAAELERGFLAWIVREHRRAFPVEVVDEARVLAALARGAAGTPAPGSTPAGAAPNASTPPASAFDVADATSEERFALALFRLGAGAERAGAEALAALAGEALPAELAERVARERRRLALWQEQRDAYLRAQAASGGSVTLTADAKPVKVKLRGFEDGEVVLEKNRLGRERVAVEELDALVLAQELPKGGANDWARLLPYVLRGDARAKKLLRDDGGEGGALLRDALDDYPARLRLGRALSSVDELARAAPPATPAEADARVAALRALRVEHGDLAAVQRKVPAIRQRAREVLDRKYTLAGDAALLAGKLEVLPGDRVRITYAFDDPHELADFEPSLYPEFFSKGFAPITASDLPFAVENGELVAVGRASLQGLYELGTPLVVRYDLAFYGETSEGNNDFAIGVADDRKEHFVWGLNFGILQRLDKEPATMDGSGELRTFKSTVYAMELRHDGKDVFLRCENREISIPAGERKEGGFFLHAHTDDPVRLTVLSLEGKLLPTSFARLRQAAVERDLAQF